MAYVGLATIRASGDIDYEELEGYDEQLQCLISTMEGTLPGSRGFGLDPDILDQTPEEDTPLSRGTWSVTSPEVVVRFRS